MMNSADGRNTQIVDLLDRILKRLSDSVDLEELGPDELKQFLKDRDDLRVLKQGFENDLFVFDSRIGQPYDMGKYQTAPYYFDDHIDITGLPHNILNGVKA